MNEVEVQLRFSPDKQDSESQRYYFFDKKTVVFFGGENRGVLQYGIQAKKLKGEKINKLQAWIAEDEMHLYLDGKHWQRSKGTRFGAFSNNKREVKI